MINNELSKDKKSVDIGEKWLDEITATSKLSGTVDEKGEKLVALTVSQRDLLVSMARKSITLQERLDFALKAGGSFGSKLEDFGEALDKIHAITTEALDEDKE